MVEESEVLDWLLEDDNPPVRLMTLIHLLHKSETDEDVKITRTRLMDYSVTQGILENIDAIWHVHRLPLNRCRFGIQQPPRDTNTTAPYIEQRTAP